MTGEKANGAGLYGCEDHEGQRYFNARGAKCWICGKALVFMGTVDL